jgi:protein-L-isoaspartate(D-aspartate) O-methyltransferase
MLRCAIATAAALALLACDGSMSTPAEPAAPAAARPGAASAEDLQMQSARQRMVEEDLQARGIRDERVLEAMRAVPRHEFVLQSDRDYAYADAALPIEEGQTISQPYIVALMCELASISPGDKVLEIGTGSGYEAAVLAEMGAEVYSIEIVEPLATSAAARLQRLGYRVQVRHGDGYGGWPEHAPFHAVLITAAPPVVPPPLEQQLTVSGRLVAPVGEGIQDLVVITRTESGFDQRSVLPVRFVPMTGRVQEPP